jgi:putative sterol carrier protein
VPACGRDIDERKNALPSNLLSPREVLDHLPDHFLPEKAGDARATVHLELTGVHAGQWTVRVAEGRCEVRDGFQGTPDLTLQADGSDYVQIMEGTLNPVAAFMQGRVKFSGDLTVALRMQGWFRPPDGVMLPNGLGR